MNIIYFTGGLGNQMFQYALYRSFELQGKRNVKGTIIWYLTGKKNRDYELEKVFPNIKLAKDDNDSFNKKRNWYLKIRKKRNWVAFINYHVSFLCIYFKEKDAGKFDERVLKLKNAACVGYWQTERYFKGIRKQLMEDFIFAYGEENLEFWRYKLSADNKSISVHIRRGDYLNNVELYGNLSESEYYDKALSYMTERIQGAHFVFFSDDILWVKENYYYESAVYMESSMFEHYEAWYDMCLMSCCTHNIIANSSFSWWGTWLNPRTNKIVIAPKEWEVGKQTQDIWCADWILM